MIVYHFTIEFVILQFLACTKKAHHVILSMSCEGRYLIAFVRMLLCVSFSWCIGFNNMFLFIRDDASPRSMSGVMFHAVSNVLRHIPMFSDSSRICCCVRLVSHGASRIFCLSACVSWRQRRSLLLPCFRRGMAIWFRGSTLTVRLRDSCVLLWRSARRRLLYLMDF